MARERGRARRAAAHGARAVEEARRGHVLERGRERHAALDAVEHERLVAARRERRERGGARRRRGREARLGVEAARAQRAGADALDDEAVLRHEHLEVEARRLLRAGARRVHLLDARLVHRVRLAARRVGARADDARRARGRDERRVRVARRRRQAELREHGAVEPHARDRARGEPARGARAAVEQRGGRAAHARRVDEQRDVVAAAVVVGAGAAAARGEVRGGELVEQRGLGARAVAALLRRRRAHARAAQHLELRGRRGLRVRERRADLDDGRAVAAVGRALAKVLCARVERGLLRGRERDRDDRADGGREAHRVRRLVGRVARRERGEVAVDREHAAAALARLGRGLGRALVEQADVAELLGREEDVHVRADGRRHDERVLALAQVRPRLGLLVHEREPHHARALRRVGRGLAVLLRPWSPRCRGRGRALVRLVTRHGVDRGFHRIARTVAVTVARPGAATPVRIMKAGLVQILPAKAVLEPLPVPHAKALHAVDLLR